MMKFVSEYNFAQKTARSTRFIPQAARRNKVAVRDDCVKAVEENR
jgi:hypothetical protein